MIIPDDICFVIPDNLASALELLQDKNSFPIAGGTDCVVEMKVGLRRAKRAVWLGRIDELKDFYIKDNKVFIGSGTTLNDLSTFKDIPIAIKKAAASVASLQIRSVATLGGNIFQSPRCIYYTNKSEMIREAIGWCLRLNGDICRIAPGSKVCMALYLSDLSAALCALNAKLHLISSDGERIMLIRELYKRDGACPFNLKRGEILYGVVVEDINLIKDSGFFKVAPRSSIDFAATSVAYAIKDDQKFHKTISFGIIGGGSMPLWGDFSMEMPKEKIIKEIARGFKPLDNNFPKARYRRIVVKRVLNHILEEIVAT